MTFAPSSTTVGVIGLGVMGSAYAANLLKAGWRVVGFDVSAERNEALSALGGRALASPRDVAAEADAILLALPSVAALEASVGGLAGATREGVVVAEMGTLPIEAKEAARAALEPNGARVLDCPVSGTGAQAAVGDLSVYASGEEATVDRMRPVFAGFARETRYCGPFGDGIKLKYVANLLVTIHNLAAAEAMLLAKRSGLDLQMTYEAISAGAGSSRMFEVRGPMMVEDRYEPATMSMALYVKDLDLIMKQAQALRCPVPLMAASLPYYAAALAEGRDTEDTAAVFAVLQQMSRPKD